MNEKRAETENPEFDMIAEDEEQVHINKYLLFTLAEQEYGLPINKVREIMGLQAITPIPEMPPYVKGVINLRGQVIPVVDLRVRFELEARDYDERTCIIIVSIEELLVGLVVDTVLEVRDIMPDQIDPPLQFKQEDHTACHNFISGLGKVEDEVKILIDAESLLGAEELLHISEE